MIRVVYNGNLGNNLFQYCFGRILAEQLGRRLIADAIPGFPKTYELVEGNYYSDGEPIILRGQRPDLSYLRTAHSLGRPILLTGYFQRYEYYRQYAGSIREWLHFESTSDVSLEPDDVVISMRRGPDYIPHYGLPLSYYENAIVALDAKRVFICTNEPHDPMVRFIASRYGASVIAGALRGGVREPKYYSAAMKNFCTIASSNRIVVSNSSFAWWAAFLSQASRIAFPRPRSGMWSLNDPISKNIALEVDEPRYEYFECEEYKSEFLTERLDVATRRVNKRFKAVARSIRATVLPNYKAVQRSGNGFRFEED